MKRTAVTHQLIHYLPSGSARLTRVRRLPVQQETVTSVHNYTCLHWANTEPLAVLNPGFLWIELGVMEIRGCADPSWVLGGGNHQSPTSTPPPNNKRDCEARVQARCSTGKAGKSRRLTAGLHAVLRRRTSSGPGAGNTAAAGG